MPAVAFENHGPTVTFGQEESLAKRNLPVSESLLIIEADIHGPLLDDGRSA